MDPSEEAPMNGLTPLIELASHRSLDLFFRVGQGYVARSAREGGTRQAAHGLSPLGIQSQAEARIVGVLAPMPREGRLYAWPGGGQRPRASLR